MADHSAAGHSSPDDEYLATPEGSTYEHTDTAIAPVAKFLVWLFIASVAVHLGLAGMYKLLIDEGVKSEASERRYPLAAGEEPSLPPAPRLQQYPRNELRTFRTDEDALLGSYGWENKAAGTVHIPIADAMRLTVERGLPVQIDPSQAPAQVGMMPADSSAGRTTERRRQ